MKNILRIVLAAAFMAMAMVSCHKADHFLTDKSYRDQVYADFEARKALAEGRRHQLFDCMDTLSLKECEAMKFLYAYMPYSDLADYDGAFFLHQVRTAFEAQETFSWGKSIPEDIFRHFVLVYRVNNEDLDSARWYFFHELKDRVKDLSMYEAALEVNHWCHEHVAYRGADIRTSAPLATMRTSLGRCGEESTFAVTALRSVGIPARQCYTPRWAHTDDNHAWVEVWVDGRWYHLGACEPDPELDMGWFDIPSTRCMMVHSNCFGKYAGSEEVNFQSPLYAKINMLPNYAPTEKISVTIKDPVTDSPIEGARVMFKLYNYSEYYTLATVKTDKEGVAQLTTGLGDLLIWATDGKRYNYAKLDVREAQAMEFYLSRESGTEYVELFDIVPPVAGEAKVVPSQAKADANNKRVAYEDSLLAAYRASFPTKENFKQYVNKNAFLTDEQLWDIIRRSEGNYREIASFLNSHSQMGSNDDKADLYTYLKSFSDKDMRDISAEVLQAHFCVGLKGAPDREVWSKGVIPARISNELVRPWRKFLAEELRELKSAQEVKRWILDNIKIDDEGNYYHCPISPRGVYELRHSDSHSRDIFFVAACRSLNIPSYLDNATNVVYYYDFDKRGWQSVSFGDKPAAQPTAKLRLVYKGKNPAKPVYWPNFTIAKYEDGEFVSFDFEDDPRMDKFPATIDIEPGYYLLSTGARYPDGDALSRLEFFEVKEGQTIEKEIVIRPLEAVNPRLANSADKAMIDPETKLYDEATLADIAGQKGLLFVFLGDYREPSKHLVKEIQQHQPEFAQWGGMTFLVAPASAKAPSWKLANTDVVILEPTAEDHLRDALIAALKLDFKGDYPLVAFVNSRGEILFHSKGYSIGLAEQILKVANK